MKYLVGENISVVLIYDEDGSLSGFEFFTDRNEAKESLNNE